MKILLDSDSEDERRVARMVDALKELSPKRAVEFLEMVTLSIKLHGRAFLDCEFWSVRKELERREGGGGGKEQKRAEDDITRR